MAEPLLSEAEQETLMTCPDCGHGVGVHQGNTLRCRTGEGPHRCTCPLTRQQITVSRVEEMIQAKQVEHRRRLGDIWSRYLDLLMEPIIREEDREPVSMLELVFEYDPSLKRAFVKMLRTRCWCGGEVGLRDPGDEDGRGCLEDINHDWRGDG